MSAWQTTSSMSTGMTVLGEITRREAMDQLD
jgi:hypothetical protein